MLIITACFLIFHILAIKILEHGVGLFIRLFFGEYFLFLVLLVCLLVYIWSVKGYLDFNLSGMGKVLPFTH